MSSWRLLACYPRRTFYPLSDGPSIREVEEKHEERYLKLAKKLESGKMFTADSDETEWKCLNCGYVQKGKEAPKVCPACAHTQGYSMQLGFVR